jgi:PPK2 family polyphosphate:nucleotide phosphotransferase
VAGRDGFAKAVLKKTPERGMLPLNTAALPMKIKCDQFRVREGEKIKLKKWDTRIKPFYESKEDYQQILIEHVEGMSRLQNLLYANGRHALLLIFQAMDAAGKDGAIKHVMSGINPQGCEVFSFKHPSPAELAHDFLWRTVVSLPERGRIGIFNRSYYEEVLIVRVHPEILQAEALPEELVKKDKIWEHRYESILNLEKHLHRNGTRIVKFFLHLSKEEQRKRFLERIDDPRKNWKLSTDDIRERDLWKDYMKAYEECLEATSTEHSPWYVIPADDKHNARLIISQVVLNTLKDLKLKSPEATEARQKELQAIRKELEK